MKSNNAPRHPEELARLETAQLQQMLRQELKKDPPDGELVRALLRTLEARYQPDTLPEDEEVEAACDRFRRFCMEEQTQEKPRPYAARGLWLRVASVLLIVGLLLCSVPQLVKAGPFKEMLTRWSDSLFELFGPQYRGRDEVEYVFKTDHPGLQKLHDAVVEQGVTIPVVPTWLPDGYILQKITHTDSPSKTGLSAVFIKGNSSIIFTADIYDPDIAHAYLKDEPVPNVHEYDGHYHNIVKNSGDLMAIWSRENIGLAISVDCTEVTLRQILNSIYVTEGN